MTNENDQPIGSSYPVKIPDVVEFDQAEWVFQFDEDPPVVIAWSSTEETAGTLTFSLQANSGSNLIFKSGDGQKMLKIYSREMPESRRRELRQFRKNEEQLQEKLQKGEPLDETEKDSFESLNLTS